MASEAQVEIHHDYAEVNGVRLHYAHAGEGPLMLLLHGFPQCWYQFRHQLREFAADHLVVAPDQRGYNLSSKPTDLWCYGTWPAVKDARELVEKLGHETFVLVGHDWGAAVGWSFALHYPRMLEALVILSTGHPALFDRELHENPEQQQSSQYLLGLRRPDSPEFFAADDFAYSRPTLDGLDFLSEEDRSVYLDAWREPGAVAGMLAWFQREGLGPPDEHGTPARGNYVPEVSPMNIEVPTLVIYGDADLYTRPGCHRGLEQYVADLTFHNIEGGSHWPSDEHPELVNRYMREFLAAKTAGHADARRIANSPVNPSSSAATISAVTTDHE
jgi:pimeloyl-ACP methyl ester carboxylesterase